jgi:hypothetical protein
MAQSSWVNASLTYHELEELLAIYKKGAVFAGDTISKESIYSLTYKDLITKNKNGDYICTNEGIILAGKILEIVERCNNFLNQQVLKISSKDSI